MDNTELQVRTAIANYFSKITQKIYVENPALPVGFRKTLMSDLERTLEEFKTDGKLSEREATALSSSFDETLLEFYSSEKRVKEVAELWFQNADFYKLKFGIFVYESDANAKIKEEYGSLLTYVHQKDKIIDSLVTKAKSEDIATATTDEAIRSAVIKEFPTKESYLSHFKLLDDVVIKIMSEVISITRENDESSFIENLGIGFMTKAMKFYQDTTINAEIKELYGN